MGVRVKKQQVHWPKSEGQVRKILHHRMGTHTSFITDVKATFSCLTSGAGFFHQQNQIK